MLVLQKLAIEAQRSVRGVQVIGVQLVSGGGVIDVNIEYRGHKTAINFFYEETQTRDENSLLDELIIRFEEFKQDIDAEAN